MPPITLLIKPASGNCNLRCKYCFYEDVTEKRILKSHGMMSDETLLTLVTRALVEADGSVYPCDFYVLDQWKIGNIFDNHFEEMFNSDVAKKFVSASFYVDEKCKICKWYKICRGGCRRDREPFADDKPVLNYFCDSYYAFFDYAMDRMIDIVKKY